MAYTKDVLEQLTVKELRLLCKDMGLSSYSRKPKITLIRMIMEAEKARNQVNDELTVKELRRLARKLDIPGYSRMRKSDLINAINSKKSVSIKRESEPSGVVIKCQVSLLNRKEFVGKTINEVISEIKSSKTNQMILNLPKNYYVVLNGVQVNYLDTVLRDGDELEFVAKTGTKG